MRTKLYNHGGHVEFAYIMFFPRVTRWHHPDSDSRHAYVPYTPIKHFMDAKTTFGEISQSATGLLSYKT